MAAALEHTVDSAIRRFMSIKSTWTVFYYWFGMVQLATPCVAGRAMCVLIS